MNAKERGVLPWVSQNRNKLAAAGCLALAGYAGYSYVHHSNDSSLAKLARATQQYCDTYSKSSELLSLVVHDLNTFMHSDSSELPQSLQQVAKLLQSPTIQDTFKTFVSSSMSAIQDSTSTSGSGSTASEIVDKVLAALTSENGRSLVSLAVGAAAKNGTAALCEFVGQRLDAMSPSDPDSGGAATPSFSIDTIISALTSEKGEQLIRTVVGESTSQAVRAYMDVPVDPKYYDDLFSSIAKPEHVHAIKEIMSSVSGVFAKELVTAYMTTPSAPAPSSYNTESTSCSTQYQTPSCEVCSSSDESQMDEDIHDSVRSITPVHTRLLLEKQNAQWVDTVVQLSKQPALQSLAVDLTKSSVREAIGSFMHVLMPQDGASGSTGTATRIRVNGMLQRGYTMISVLLSLVLYMCTR